MSRKLTRRIRYLSVTITKKDENGVLEVRRARKLTLRIRYVSVTITKENENDIFNVSNQERMRSN